MNIEQRIDRIERLILELALAVICGESSLADEVVETLKEVEREVKERDGV